MNGEPFRPHRVTLLCTDRGTHPARTLGWIAREGGTVMFSPWYEPGHRHDGPMAVPGRFQVRCPTCARTVPMREATAARLLDTPWPEVTWRVDISLL